MAGVRKTKVEVDKLNEKELRELVPTLLQQIAELQRMVYGRSSEKSSYMDPTSLLPFVERDELRADLEEAEAKAKTVTVTVPAHERKVNSRRKDFPDYLPRRHTEHELFGDDLLCPGCGEPRCEFGEETAQELEHIEFTYVHVIHRKKYVCRPCQGNIIVASGGQRVIEKSILGPGFLAQIIFERFGSHMPYARLEQLRASHHR